MAERIKLKSMAKEQIKGNIPILFLCMLLIVVISAGISYLVPILGTIVISFVTPALTLGMISIYMGLAHGEKPKFEGLFSGMPVFIKAFLLQLVTGLFVFLWSLLLFVPGIIKGIAYMFAPYALAENHETGVMEALDISKKITQGHKMELFILSLSFFPWILLVMVTFGIAAVYVIPYVQMTLVNAYYDLKNVSGVVVVDAPYEKQEGEN